MSRTPRQQRARRLRTFRITVFVALGLFFLVPLISMAEYSTRVNGGGRSGAAWAALVTDPDLRSGILTSLELAVLTVVGMIVLLVPTMVWVRLRVPKAARTIEFLCLLPLTIPALVIVVGIAPVYAWVTYFLGNSALTLTFAYVVLVLPYSFRALDAGLSGIDVQTLSDAARSLGAGWFTVIARVIVPNIASALLSAAFISVALVLGEYTFASLLDFQNMQVVIDYLGKSNSQASVAASLAALIFGFLLLLLLTLVGRRRRGEPAVLAPTPQPGQEG
ncbi:ABC transporter permease [Leekyejoonella antrihumi]|uniref:ABC transporter permease subunit n=1 Tax=Leekyejoonella antrihumi TaxID=1660198 RepID=A0A563E4E6_9MICO|nr:ABC transporter permease subunit [Leekyejoonella antrihumi]TWP37285.1 ABC transporter permease subunit [Leekyejoonella antrihumi]